MSNLALRALSTLAVAMALGCQSPPLRHGPIPAPAAEETRPADYIPARNFTTTKDLLAQLYSVVEGTVEDIRFEMHDCWGPRTVLTITNVQPLVGGSHPPTIELYTFGGVVPDGSYVEVSELPRYVLGARYVLFLRNTDWRYSPVIGDHAYRLERVAGKDVLLTTSGRAVTGISDAGIETNTGALAGPVGYRVKGLAESFRRALDTTSDGLYRRCDGRATTEDGCLQPADAAAEKRDREEARRRIILTQRFAQPEILSGLSEAAVAAAIGPGALKQQLERWISDTQIRPSGRFVDRPRYGCWNSTPTVRERRSRDLFIR